ncbi:hypothetical protein WN51_10568 [Melipona quadrifasciata]|uniref:Uncharacterized protein n=1 Tax=Melipona quadrifasciata TaxID=166423 RepID=A0A0N0U6G7_9HYME|nr:hypothetical protein WN51_10568 [Melipona quadrifasciata]
MSEKKVDTEIVQKQYTNDASLIDEAEIIDVSVFDFDDSNGWLYIPSEYKMESTVHDLYTWLRTEPELSFSASRKSIDTRTFTRSKKRSSRTSFESILESLSSPVSNTWRTSNFSNIDEKLFSKYSDIITANKKEAVPPMLKMALNANSNFLPEEPVTSGQESMEVFLNMSHSKGIDSFINLVEPGLNDPLMNISQPSIFYSSIISLPKDDSLHSTESSKHEESLNVTRCSQEIDKCEDAKDLNINETFLKVNESDNNVTSYCLSTTNKTFTNKSDVEKDINETYNTDVTPKMVVLSSSDKDRFSTTKLSSTYVNKNDDTQILQLENNERKESCNLNTTYPSAFKKAENSSILSTTYCTENIENAISNTTLTETSDMQYDKDQVYNFQKSTICDVPKNAVAPMFKLPAFQSTPKSTDTESRTITESFESSRVYNTTLNLNFKASTLLRKELLSEIYKTGDHRLDCAFNHEHQSGEPKKEIESEILSQNVKDDIPAENKYNTYRKESSINKIKSHAETTDEAGACIKNLPDKKYYTFTKKGSNHGGRTDMENAESLDNADATFTKPFLKPQKRKQHIPRMLSKLPQFLQKSNPNLVSNSLKTVNITTTNASNYGYMKGSQPNIVKNVEKSLANKSTCSDSSHNSYTMQPMNIEQLHQIVRMQEESLKQDVTSRLNKRVLENTWIDVKKDLPSPILKNGVDNCDSNSLSTKFNVTTSSPIESPMRSSQSNTDGQSTETALKQQNEVDAVKKVEVFNKPITKVENKTRLRQPTNWNMGSRSTNPMSAIPRPPSRIPAPRFVRPTVKNIQGILSSIISHSFYVEDQE